MKHSHVFSRKQQLEEIKEMEKTKTTYSRQNECPFLPDVHILILRTCEYITLDGQGDFVDAIKLRLLRGETTLDYPDGLNLITRILISKREAGESELDTWRWYSIGFEGGGSGHQPRNTQQCLEAGRAKETFSPRAFR